MKHKLLVLTATVMSLASCSPNTRTSNNINVKDDSGTKKATEQVSPKMLFASLRIKSSIKAGDSVKLKFTVYNPTDSVKQFCKWHTPFEPLMSKYLEIKDTHGEEAAYRGAMAKRMMPPPASSYQKINPGDSLSIDVDLLKGYAIQKPAQYSISYTGQGE
ncbi:protease [Pedobacter sp. NJ-S-72]